MDAWNTIFFPTEAMPLRWSKASPSKVKKLQARQTGGVSCSTQRVNWLDSRLMSVTLADVVLTIDPSCPVHNILEICKDPLAFYRYAYSAFMRALVTLYYVVVELDVSNEMVELYSFIHATWSTFEITQPPDKSVWAALFSRYHVVKASLNSVVCSSVIGAWWLVVCDQMANSLALSLVEWGKCLHTGTAPVLVSSESIYEELALLTHSVRSEMQVIKGFFLQQRAYDVTPSLEELEEQLDVCIGCLSPPCNHEGAIELTRWNPMFVDETLAFFRDATKAAEHCPVIASRILWHVRVLKHVATQMDEVVRREMEVSIVSAAKNLEEMLTSSDPVERDTFWNAWSDGSL